MTAIPAELAQTLAAVVDEGTLDAAARRLHVTPSAVSQRIRQLEQRVGQVLLVRSKPARPTDAGAHVVRLARQLSLLEQDTLAALGGAAGSTERISIPLAVNADSMSTWLLEPLGALARELPVVFDLHRDDQDFTADLLESGTVMAAVTSRAEPIAGCRVRALGVMVYTAVATPAYVDRWLGSGADAAALSEAPLVQFDRKDDLQSQWLRSRGVEPSRPPRHYVPASQDFAQAVLLGLGWGMLPDLQSRGAMDSGDLVRIGGAAVPVPLYWQQWNLRSATLDAVADAVATRAAGVLSPR
jgi:LysR family transcriptional regulator (chromosome initiation inhibitor)